MQTVRWPFGDPLQTFKAPPGKPTESSRVPQKRQRTWWRNCSEVNGHKKTFNKVRRIFVENSWEIFEMIARGGPWGGILRKCWWVAQRIPQESLRSPSGANAISNKSQRDLRLILRAPLGCLRNILANLYDASEKDKTKRIYKKSIGVKRIRKP